MDVAIVDNHQKFIGIITTNVNLDTLRTPKSIQHTKYLITMEESSQNKSKIILSAGKVMTPVFL